MQHAGMTCAERQKDSNTGLLCCAAAGEAIVGVLVEGPWPTHLIQTDHEHKG